MGVLLSVSSQSFGVGQRTFTPTLGPNKREIRASFVRTAWPVGPCLRLTYWYPDGSLAGTVTFDGGNTLDRQGQPLSHAGLRGADGGTLPAGQYTVQAEVLQAITTAVTVQDA